MCQTLLVRLLICTLICTQIETNSGGSTEKNSTLKNEDHSDNI